MESHCMNFSAWKYQETAEGDDHVEVTRLLLQEATDDDAEATASWHPDGICHFSELASNSCWLPNRIAHVAYRLNQRRITNFLSEPANENFYKLGVIFMCVLPHALAEFRASEYTVG